MVKSHIKSQIGARIKAARKAAGYTQPGLAEALGLESHMAVSRWERGKNMPTEENARDLCRILGRPEKYFLGEEKPTKTVSELTRMLEERDAEIEALKAQLKGNPQESRGEAYHVFSDVLEALKTAHPQTVRIIREKLGLSSQESLRGVGPDEGSSPVKRKPRS